MGELKCEYLIRDEICNGNIDVCCIYQNLYKYPTHEKLHSIRETFCDYPNVNKNNDYVKVIEELSIFLKRS